MKHKLTIFFLLLALCPLQLFGQQLTILSLMEDPNDATARAPETRRLDAIRRPCALLKVMLTENGATFNSTDLIEASGLKMDQYWVYLAQGAKLLDINVPGFHPLSIRLSDINPAINALQGNRTYVLTLSGEKNLTDKQQLIFQVSPSTALLEVDGAPWHLSNGIASQRVNYGIHTYRLSMADYYTQEGVVAVYRADAPTQDVIELKPAFGMLNVRMPIEADETLVYANSQLIGYGSVTGCKLPSGKYLLRILTRYYKPFEREIEITDGKSTSIDAVLTPDFADVTLQAKSKAEIWIDGTMMGTTKWNGRLKTGEYLIQVYMPNRQPQSQVITITPESPSIIMLDAPQPRFGSLAIESQPMTDATILIDGVEQGTTPQICKMIPIGKHTVELKKEGYKTASTQVIIEENKTAELTIKLEEKTSRSFWK